MAPKVAKSKVAEAERPRSRSPKREEEAKEAKEEKEEKFQEPDAKADSRSQNKEKICFETPETTMNVVQTLGGKVLTSLTEGGMSCFLGGARANVGQKAGRYMFEANMLEALEQAGGGKQAKPSLMIGFSTSSSSLMAGAECVFFDNEGSFSAGKKRQQMKNGRIGNRQVAAVVLNLDSKSPNFNTVALYRDGVAVGEPMPLPDELKEKALFPHVVFRNCSVATNFGPTALKELPFKCRMLGAAAASDCSVAPSKESKDGKYEVVVPVAMPDEGTFDWVDSFLESHPNHVELSDRMINNWAHASGIWGKGGKGPSNDKPDLSFGLPGQDANSLRKVLHSVAPLVPRNYVVMEVRNNLLATGREEVTKRFNYPCYKKVAHVVMGEPPKEYKAIVQNKILKEKQAKADAAHKRDREALTRKKAAAQRQKEAAKQKKEIEKKKKAAAEEKKAKEAAEKGEEYTKPDEPMEEEEKEDAEVEKDMPEEAPAVELDEDEKMVFFPKRSIPDLTSQAMNSSFSKFSAPEVTEGFDDIKYEWGKASKVADYLQKWIQDRKVTTRVDDIKPGQAFKEKQVEFEKLFKAWQAKKEAAKKPSAKQLEELNDLDIFSVTDVSDASKGLPLFGQFSLEDWELAKLRFEFGMIVWAFKKDTEDERTGIPLDHIGFYFAKYFNRGVNNKKFGAADITELLLLIKDTVTIKDNIIVSQLSDDIDNLDIFVKLAEEGRRERARRIEAGDETARLKFTIEAPKPAPTPVPKAATPAPKVAAAKPAAVKPAAAKPNLGATAAPKAGAGVVKPSVTGTVKPTVGKAAPTQITSKGCGKKGKW